MTALNEITAILAAVLMLLVARGFVPYLHWRDVDAAGLMRMSIVLLSGLSLARMAWWDLLRPLLGLLEIMPPTTATLLGQSLNAGFNLVTAAAAVAALGALHRSIPVEYRGQYTWLTAPRYPHRTGLLRRMLK